MKETWKEKFDKEFKKPIREDFRAYMVTDDVHTYWDYSNIKDFISKEIIEKIIDEIPDEHNGKIYALPKRLENWFDLKELKQQLKDKYLN